VRSSRVVGCALVVALLAACGSNDPNKSRREAVNRYLTGVQNAQVTLTGRQGQIDTALQSFTLAKPSPKELRSLRLAHTTIAGALRNVRALEVPPDARRLQQLVVRRLVVQEQLVDELVQSSRDVTRVAAVAPPLSAAAGRLRTDLAAIASSPTRAKVPKGGSSGMLARYGAAFGRYGDALRPLAPRVAPAEAPSLLRPTLEAQQSALQHSVILCDTIRRALAKPDIPLANKSIHDLLTIAATLGGADLSRREAAVARVYNAKIAQVNKLARAVEKERGRLVREIG
jgi:hypothetical protein